MHLLVGVDGSEPSMRALDRSLDRVRETGDNLTVALLGDADGADENLDSRVREHLAESAIDATVRPVDGNPGHSLVELSDGDDFDRLVIAGGERSPLGKINLDSFIEYVILNATTSVTLIR